VVLFARGGILGIADTLVQSTRRRIRP
jgi:hypothetical protein